MLPISNVNGVWTSYIDCLFTSVSATCVTGLIVFDTASYWSYFGQFIILLLIQIGGLGVVTISLLGLIFAGKKVSIQQRSLMQDSISAHQIGGIVKLTLFILKITLIIELLGALFMFSVFYTDFGLLGVWKSIFHSISAFCNAGFDLLGSVENKFCSLTEYSSNIILNIVTMFLIIVGGLGFTVWSDIKQFGIKIKRYGLQSKIVLFTSLFLIIIPAIYFYFFEFNNLVGIDRLLGSLFQSVTTRTAGFNSLDFNNMSEVGKLLSICLMLIGGSPGSTAGGLKTTTIAVLVLSSFSAFSKKDDIECFGRRIDWEIVKKACGILLMYLMLFIVSGCIISMIEGIDLLTCLFETASAIGTVGLTLGITSTLGIVSKCILMFLMFFGRVGCLTLIFAALSPSVKNVSKKPMEKVNVG
jgi:trk system potassium uptake protein TrkH